MLPEGFVYLDEVDSTILQDIRYATELNFVGSKIDGYLINRAVMTRALARILSSIQKQVSKDGFSLVIYDAYRPQKAIRHFSRWAQDKSQKMILSLYKQRPIF